MKLKKILIAVLTLTMLFVLAAAKTVRHRLRRKHPRLKSP